jgi:hypothetical protein
MTRLIAGLLLAAAAGPALAFTLPPIEPVYAVKADRLGVTVRLGSGACTAKPDMTVAVAKATARPMLLIARKHPAACPPLSGPAAQIAWTYEELGLEYGQPFSLANPLVSEPDPAAR